MRVAGATVLLVTHFMDQAERLCDRIGVVDGDSPGLWLFLSLAELPVIIGVALFI